MVAENYRYVLKKVEEACVRSGRDPKDVTLIAVSKTKPVEMIEEAMEAGARVFGENKVQELCDKYCLLYTSERSALASDWPFTEKQSKIYCG